jgi:hypothetical protein
MIEIRELIIRACIDDGAAKNNGTANAPMQGMNNHDMEKVIAMCAEEVMKAIKRQMER